VMVTTFVLWRRVVVPPRPEVRWEAGRAVATDFSLPSLRWLPLVSVDWDWIEPRAVMVEARPSGARLHEEVVFFERGEHRRTVRRIGLHVDEPQRLVEALGN